MFNNNSSKGQTTIELLLILTVSVVILAIIYSIYADQFTGNVSSTELFLARSSVQKIVNASNTAYLSGIGSIIKVEVDFPSSVDFDNSKLSSNIISLKLLGGLDVVGIADINFGGSLRKQYGKQVIYLVFDGNKVNLDYLDFELNQYNISFSTLADTNRKETISVRNNSSSNMSFVIENNFSSPGVNIILSKTEFVLAPNAIEYIDFNFIIAKSAIGNYSGNVVFNTMINDVNISKTVSVSTEVLLEMSELMIYPLNTSFTTTANNSVEKSFSVCNKSLNKIEDIAWSSIGESGDGNIINWILNFSDLTNITELNSGECENIVLEFTIPQVSLKKFEASITASYNNSKKIDSEYTTFIFVNVIGTKNYFKQVFDNNLNANYFLSNFVKKDEASIRPTGELDWNNLARNDTSESKVDNNIIYYGRELDETNFLFNDSNILGVWHLNNDLVDSTGNNTGVTNNGVDLTENGFWNTNAGYFNGSSYAFFPYNSDFDFQQTTPFTISVWVRIDNLSLTNGYIVTNRYSLNVPYAGFGLLQSGGNIKGIIGGYASGSSKWWDAIAPIQLGWNHVVYVNTGVAGEQKIFVNGSAINSVASQSGDVTLVYNSNARLTFGKSRADGAHYFNGAIEEVNIWNRNLNDDEVKSLYSSQSVGFKEDVVGLWHLDGDIVDSSESGFVGIDNNVNLDANGLWGTNAGEFNGSNSNIVIGDVLDLGLDDMTISAWIKTDYDCTNYQYFISKTKAAGQFYRYGVALADESSGRRGKVFVLIAWNTSGHTSYYGNKQINDGLWHNVVVVFDRTSNLLIYIDGVLDATYDISSNVSLNFQSNNPFRIGGYTAGDNVSGLPSYYFNGLIEEVTIYKRAIPYSEVRDIYNLQKGNWLDKDLVAYYKFNEVNGTTIFDSARGNDGVLTNGANINAKGMWDSNALSLDGVNKYVNLNSNLGLGGKKDVTFSAWIYNNLNFSNWTGIITDKVDNSNDLFLGGWNNPNMGYCFGTNDAYVYTGLVDSKDWHQLVGTYDGEYLKIYYDGMEIMSTVHSTTIITDEDFQIGWDRGLSSRYWGGLIDEVKIYSRALTSAEILADYNSFLNSKFVDNNIIDAENEVTWQSLKINSDLNYSFGNELNSQFDENIVGLWHLNGDVNDASSNGFHGVNNNVTFSNGLWDTNAGVFNGSNSYFTTNYQFTYGQAVTVVAWVYSTQTGTDVYRNVFDTVGADPMIWWRPNGSIEFDKSNGYVTPISYRDQWVFVAISKPAGNTAPTYYVNGVGVIGPRSYNVPALKPTWFNRNGNQTWKGFADEIIVWDKALSAEEILDLFENSSKRIDLEVYSCSDANCSNKTSTQEIASMKNNFSYDLSLNDSRYFGWNAYFRKASGLEDLLNNNFSKMPFIKDINIVSIIE